MLIRIFFILTLFIIGIFTVSSMLYSLDGESLFVEKCGSCHKNGGEAPVFAPVKYASSQWERFFQQDKHKRKKDISALIELSDINAIKKYLIDHAADSDRPIAAGLR
ncbi:MAG: cytochrome c [Desulfobacterales bacterium]|nr:cytochrome c [Desulfobacterales bacterium]